MNMYSNIMRAAVSVFPLAVAVSLFSFLVENIHIVIPPGDDASLYCLDCICQ